MGFMQFDYKEMLCCICQALCQVQESMEIGQQHMQRYMLRKMSRA